MTFFLCSSEPISGNSMRCRAESICLPGPSKSRNSIEVQNIAHTLPQKIKAEKETRNIHNPISTRRYSLTSSVDTNLSIRFDSTELTRNSDQGEESRAREETREEDNE
ncbi:hypothetical protein RHMOL_Rhmol04G0031700 [Rhododendron molle]|uniref:Uncharacterized protein n=1 Tax=Rhododendron molle TaxID=49168 RepID=A0ACC0NXV7_RHOML|nr:hypothetical protein RHMOL_Rhmol04G0031700 [Rhododendron molle]